MEEKIKVRLELHGCDATTERTFIFSDAEYRFLKSVAKKINAKSEYQCYPTMEFTEIKEGK